MEIRKLYYPVRRTEKYAVFIGGKRYTCYLDPICGNTVCTGDGKSDDCQIITGSILASQIIIACSNWKRYLEDNARETRGEGESMPTDLDAAMFCNGVSWKYFI